VRESADLIYFVLTSLVVPRSSLTWKRSSAGGGADIASTDAGKAMTMIWRRTIEEQRWRSQPSRRSRNRFGDR
jgi:hypothetical protein